MTYDNDGSATSTYSDSASSDSSTSGVRYQGVFFTPSYGTVNEQLDKITIILERLDANGTPLKINSTHATDVVMHISLVSDDGTLDLDLTETGERLFEGTLVQTPTVSDNKMVFTFLRLKIHRAGTYRVRALVFNLSSIVPTMLATTASSLATRTDAVYTGISDLLVIVQST